MFLTWQVFFICIQEDNTPLYAASKRGHSQVVKILLTAIPRIDVANKVSCFMNNCTCPLIKMIIVYSIILDWYNDLAHAITLPITLIESN